MGVRRAWACPLYSIQMMTFAPDSVFGDAPRKTGASARCDPSARNSSPDRGRQSGSDRHCQVRANSGA
jgi:hypothetical protein